ncbi:hypothetical protein V5N11_021726 [Cardamine amara subsp. amara]|uniref:DUF223 domain-containing protein n=1 Tax=Cardamine amara subsp. amara TaxID=228776 RepID=A0ABD1BS17_CARAN
MAPSTSSFSPKLLPCVVFDDLKKGFANKEVVVRVIHFWEARNPRKGGLLMGLELLLIDKKSTVIQAFITAN